MGIWGKFWGKFSGKTTESKYQVQIAEILLTIKDNEILRNTIMDLRGKLWDREEEVRSYKDTISSLNGKISDLEEEISVLTEKKTILEERTSGIMDNPLQSSIISILNYQPKIRSSTIANFLGVTTRTVRNYRNEYLGKTENHNSGPAVGNTN